MHVFVYGHGDPPGCVTAFHASRAVVRTHMPKYGDGDDSTFQHKGRPGNSLWTNKMVYSCFSKFSTCLNNVGDVKMVPNKLMQLLTSLRDTSLSFWGRFAVCTFSQPPPCRCFSMVGPLGRFPPALLGSLSDRKWPSSVWQGGLKTPKMGPQILFVDLQSECGECNQLGVYM